MFIHWGLYAVPAGEWNGKTVYGEWKNTWNEKYGKEIYAYCRSLKPGLIINNRVGAGRMHMKG